MNLMFKITKRERETYSLGRNYKKIFDDWKSYEKIYNKFFQTLNGVMQHG